MKIAPFYYDPPAGSPTPPPHYPYHDDTNCPEGQRVQQSGHWQPYVPTRIADTRVRCPSCLSLDKSQP